MPNDVHDRAEARKVLDALSDLLSAAADSLEDGDDAAATAGP